MKPDRRCYRIRLTEGHSSHRFYGESISGIQGISPEKTHDIRKLTLEAAVHEPRFNEVMDMAVALTPYAWEFRYPDDLAETYPTRE
jgi:HEPN domain-containing protein